MTDNHNVVSKEEWLEARKRLLAKEKEFTRQRDEINRLRRELPWERVDKAFAFEGPRGRVTLSELFDGKSQLIVYHFMFDPGWDAGCKSCSFWADNFNGIDIHLKHRDTSFVVVSRAPYEKLEAYKKRMGWSFKWVSAAGSDFPYDYYASFKAEEVKSGGFFNYANSKPYGEDVVGISVFAKNGAGEIFHTYSCYARGVDMMNGAYHYIDLTPKGRDEEGHANPQFWVRRHDEYDDR